MKKQYVELKRVAGSVDQATHIRLAGGKFLLISAVKPKLKSIDDAHDFPESWTITVVDNFGPTQFTVGCGTAPDYRIYFPAWVECLVKEEAIPPLEGFFEVGEIETGESENHGMTRTITAPSVTLPSEWRDVKKVRVIEVTE